MNKLKTYLTEAYSIDNKSILRILTQNKQIDQTDPNYSYYNNLATWANSSGKQQKIKNIDLTKIKLSDKGLITKNKLITRYTTLGHLLNALKTLMDQEGKYNPENELSKLIQLTTLEILAGLSGIKGKTTQPEEPEEPDDPEDPKQPDEPETPEEPDKPKLSSGIDWTAERAKRLVDAQTTGENTSKVLDKFYNDYYKIEYAGLESSDTDDEIVTKLKSLDKILIQEFTKLGYNPEVNPLAQFLKILIKLKKENKSKIFDKLTTNTYGAIHNSFIAKYITGNMLGNYMDKNILFCEDLYNYKGLDIVKYLSIQKSISGAAKADKRFESDPELLTVKVLIQQEVSGENYDKKVDALINLTDPVLPTAPTAKLRSFLEISELTNYVFPNNSISNTKTEEEREIDKKLSTIVGLAEIKKVVLSMIQLILNQNSFEKSYPKETAAYKKWLADIGYTPNDRNISISNGILSVLSEDFNLTDADKLLLINKLRAAYIKASKKAKS